MTGSDLLPDIPPSSIRVRAREKADGEECTID